MLTIDEIASPQTRFVKIDVEGYETEVLQGAARVLAEVRPLVLLETNPDGEEAWREGLRLLLAAGYALFWFFVPFATPRTSRCALERATRGDANVLALPPGVANTWNLRPVTDADAQRPRTEEAHAYMKAYGYFGGP